MTARGPGGTFRTAGTAGTLCYAEKVFGILHVANGHGTTRLIEQAHLPGRTSIWADPLHEGPIVNADDDELIRIRAAAIARDLGESAAEVEADLRSWRRVVDADDRYDELVLWYEHDVFDQLNLIQLLSRIGRDRPARKPVSLVSIDAYPGQADFKGLGELAPADIAALFTQRRPVTREQLAVAAQAWDAFRSQERPRLEALLREDTSPLPFLAAALRRYLDEAPAGPGGLTRSEQRLLEQLAQGPVEIQTAWRRMHDGETAFYITDSSFWSLLKGLADRRPALIDISLHPVAPPGRHPNTHTLRVRDAGLPPGTLSLRS